MKETSFSFCPFDSLAVNGRTWEGHHNKTTCLHFSIKMKMVIFVFVVVDAACACFIVAWDGVSQLSVSLVQQVLHA
jgi:hypothetical protein